MPWLHVDQRSVRDQCVAILARAPAADRLVTKRELIDVLRRTRLVPGARVSSTAWLLMQLEDPAKQRRTIERAIPRRGALRPGRTALALLAVGAAVVGLGWRSPWLLVLPAAIAVALLWGWLRRWLHPGGAAVHVYQMEQRARLAESVGDTTTLAALHEEARQMIAEDRVPPRVGFRLANVLAAATDLTPFPIDLLRDLQQLLLFAPETDLTYDAAYKKIERRFELRVHQLASRLRLALHDATNVEPLLDECSRLIERLSPTLLVHLPPALDEVAAATTEPATADRARTLRARLVERRNEAAERLRARSTPRPHSPRESNPPALV